MVRNTLIILRCGVLRSVSVKFYVGRTARGSETEWPFFFVKSGGGKSCPKNVPFAFARERKSEKGLLFREKAKTIQNGEREKKRDAKERCLLSERRVRFAKGNTASVEIAVESRVHSAVRELHGR